MLAVFVKSLILDIFCFLDQWIYIRILHGDPIPLISECGSMWIRIHILKL